MSTKLRALVEDFESLLPGQDDSTANQYKVGADTAIVNFGFVGHDGERRNQYSLPTPFRTFYVDPENGSDSNSGLNQTSPWKTLLQVGSNVQAGDQVLLMNGVFRETLIPVNSGTPSAPIVIAAMPGHKPVIRGSNIASDWVPMGAVETGGFLVGSAEVGNLTEFPNYQVDASNELIVSSSQKHSGNSSFQITYGGVNSNARLAKNFTDTNDVYARAFFRLDSQFNLTDDGDLQKMFLLRNQALARDLIAAYIARNGANYEVRVAYHTGTLGPVIMTLSSSQLTKNQWFSLELHYRADAGNGTAEVWLNDELVGSVGGLNTFDCGGGSSACAVNRVELGSPNGTTKLPVAGSKIWIDNARLASSRNGVVLHTGSPGVYKISNINTPPRQVFINNDYYPSMITLEHDFETRFAQDSSLATSQIREGSFFYDSALKTIYLKMPSANDPRNYLVEIGARNENILLKDKANFILKDLVLQHANKDNAGSISIQSSENIKVLDCVLRDNYGAGILLRAGSADNIISGNQFWDNKKEFGSGVRIDMQSRDNIIEYNTVGTSVDFESISTVSSGLPSNFNYTDHSGGSAFFFRYDGDSSTPEFFGSPTGNVIRFNRVNNVVDSAVYMADQVSDNEVHSNIFSNIYAARPWGSSGGNGVHIAKSSTGNKVYNNIIFNVDTAAINLRSGADNNVIYNNTFYKAGLKSPWHSSRSSSVVIVGPTTSAPTAPASVNNQVFNNIMHSAAGFCYDVDSASAASGSNQLNNNLCYNPTGEGAYRWAGGIHSSLASLRSSVDQEESGLNEDPQFISLVDVSLNFSLHENSPGQQMGRSPSPYVSLQPPSDSLVGNGTLLPVVPAPPIAATPPENPPGNLPTDDLVLEMSAVPFDLTPAQAYFSKDISYGTHERNSFDILLPKAAWDTKTPTGLVVFYHGGGFTQGSKEKAYDKKNLIRSLLSNGIAFVTVNYPLLDGTHTNGVMDSLNGSRRALQFVRKYANSLNVDPNKIVLMGSSAGASTALWLSMHNDLRNPASPDLVERESTRVLGAVVTETQATLDVVKWENIFSTWNLSINSFASTVRNLYSISDINQVYSEPMVSYRANLDVLGLMDSADPEIWVANIEINNVAPTSSSILFHHPLHAKALQDAAAANGVAGVFNIPKLGISTSAESEVSFVLRKFNEVP